MTKRSTFVCAVTNFKLLGRRSSHTHSIIRLSYPKSQVSERDAFNKAISGDKPQGEEVHHAASAAVAGTAPQISLPARQYPVDAQCKQIQRSYMLQQTSPRYAPNMINRTLKFPGSRFACQQHVARSPLNSVFVRGDVAVIRDVTCTGNFICEVLRFFLRAVTIRMVSP